MTAADLTGLNADSGRLNAALREAERLLRDLNVGVDVNVTMSNKQRLYFSREPGTRDWGLYVRDEKVVGTGTAPLKYTSIHEASRETRAEASRFLKPLLDAMLLAAEKMQENVAEAADKAEDFVALMKARQVGASVRRKP